MKKIKCHKFVSIASLQSVTWGGGVYTPFVTLY